MNAQITRVIEKGNLKAAEKLLKVELEKQNRTKFDKELREEYEGLYPEYRPMTDEEYDEYTDSLGDSETAIPQEDTKVKIEYIAADVTRTPAEYLTYSEWVTAKIQREETYEEYQQAGGELSEDGFNDATKYTKQLINTEELVHQYTPLTAEELNAKVEEYTPLQTAIKAKAEANYQAKADSLVVGYSKFEVESFGVQETEASAYKADNTVSTPMLDALVAARCIDKDVLVDKILEKAELFKVAIGSLLGAKQAELG